jgi:phosphoserine phosphatase
MLQALIFDVDGTLADTELAHLAAFNQAFAELGLNWRWDEALYTQVLAVSGGKKRIKAWWHSQKDRPQVLDATAMDQTIDRIHDLKTAAYEQAVQDGQVQMRPGVLALLSAAADAGLQLAIATTTSPVNIAALMRQAIGIDWRYHLGLLRRMPDYVNYIVPQFAHTHVNFQRVPMVDTSNPFIAQDIPSADESMVVIRFANPKGIDFQYLRSMIHDSWMSRANTIVVPGGKMELAMQLIFTPFVWRLMERRKRSLGLA